MNLGHIIAGGEERYLDHCEEDAGGTENSLGWHDSRELLRKIQALDGHIQG